MSSKHRILLRLLSLTLVLGGLLTFIYLQTNQLLFESSSRVEPSRKTKKAASKNVVEYASCSQEQIKLFKEKYTGEDQGHQIQSNILLICLTDSFIIRESKIDSKGNLVSEIEKRWAPN